MIAVTDFDGMASEDFADSYYDVGGYANDCVIFFYSVNDSEVYILTNGLATDAISEDDINSIFDDVTSDIRAGNVGLAFDAYAKEDPQNYYYMDVYSTVAFSEKMFKNVDNSQKNYDLLGGWVSGSPLQKDATLPYYDERMSEAELLLQDNFYFVIERERSLDFLYEFYTTQGITLNTEIVDKIGNKDNPLVVHEVSALGF